MVKIKGGDPERIEVSSYLQRLGVVQPTLTAHGIPRRPGGSMSNLSAPARLPANEGLPLAKELPMDCLDYTAVPGWMHHVVYFVGTELKRGCPVKIGTTQALSGRFSQLRGSSPVPLFLLSIVRGSTELEARLHREFARTRLHGEWFRITPTLLDRMLGYREIYFENCRRMAAMEAEETCAFKAGTRVHSAYKAAPFPKNTLTQESAQWGSYGLAA